MSVKTNNNHGKKQTSNSKGKGSVKTQNYSKDKSTNESVVPSTTTANYDAIRSNDIDWWNKSPIFSDAVRLPFNRITGDPVELPDQKDFGSGVTLYNYKRAVPGIMRIGYIPTIGSTDNGSNAPVNRAFTSLYGAIYSKTTGAMQFTQASLALFMTGLTSIANMIAEAKRVLGVSQLYNGTNYYYPKGIIKALGFDPAEIIGHQDSLRMLLNDSILSFNNLKVPDFMNIYRRQYGLAHNIYADEDDTRAQLYAFVSDGYYIYSDVNNKLIWMDKPATFAGLLSAINDCLMSWRNSSDLGLISGSIQRAFSEANMITLDYVATGDVVLPTVDRNINWQIQNSDATVMDYTSLDITEDVVNNVLVFKPKMSADVSPQGLLIKALPLKYINSYDGVIDEEFIMEATRLMSCPMPLNTGGGLILDLPNSNTEIVTSYSIYVAERNGTTDDIDIVQACKIGSTLLVDASNGVSNDTLAVLPLISKFKFAPRLNIINDVDGRNTNLGFIGDLYRYTTIDVNTLKGLNEAALQSIYSTNVL